jgi:hypothetical protein
MGSKSSQLYVSRFISFINTRKPKNPHGKITDLFYLSLPKWSSPYEKN